MADIPSYDNLPELLEKLTNADNFRLAPRLAGIAQDALLRPNPRLDRVLANSAAKGLPPISVLPLAGQYLSILTQLIGAKTVLEVGTLGGYSSTVFAQAGARVTSIEINPKHRDVALENVDGLDVEVLLGDATTVLPQLAAAGRQFDLVFIDANMDHMWEHFDAAVRLTRVGGAVFLDDVVIGLIRDDLVDAEKDTILTRVGRDTRVQATLMPTVISHPQLPTPALNGFILALVKSH